MPRTGQDKKGLDPKVERAREAALQDFMGLHKKALEHIRESLEAVIPCVYCDKEGKANKLDVEGKCLKCHGTKLIPDIPRREWATDHIEDRVSPKPKAVEMSVDKNEEVIELEKIVGKMKDEELNQAKDMLDKLLPGFSGTTRPS